MLIAFDFDGTLSDSEMTVLLGEQCGVADEMEAITERAMNDEIDYATSLRERAALLDGLSEDAAAEAYAYYLSPDVGVVLEEWLIDDKDLRPLPGATRIFVGAVERETEKAILLDQGDRDDWVPKSCSEAYVTRPGVTIETPQTGLGSYAAAEDGNATVSEVSEDA